MMGEQQVGPIEAMAAAFVLALPFGEGDPRRGQCDVIVALARLVDLDRAMPQAIRELRTQLLQVLEVPGEPAGPVDGIRLSRARRLLAMFEESG